MKLRGYQGIPLICLTLWCLSSSSTEQEYGFSTLLDLEIEFWTARKPDIL